jgi:serine/threonine protein kinase
MARAVVETVEALCNQLNRSRLLLPSEVRGMYQQWRSSTPADAQGEMNRFVKWLVTKHYLTSYQVMQLLVGQVDHLFLNHYKLLDLVGKGRMAGIFKGVHRLGHIVAVKIMPQSKALDPKLMARFKREAKMAVRLKHPNAVRTFHMGKAGKRHYIVMEFLEGETLEDVLKRRKKLAWAEGVRLIHQALQGLEHIHENNLVHRDLKPGNLMLVPPRPPGAADNTVHATLKILDIGLGRILFDENVTPASEEMKLTTEGMVLGTHEYMSPEQARDPHKADIKSDIYSLGCVLYHVLAGQPPFTDKDPLQQILRHASEPPRPLREHESSVPDKLQPILNTMLAKSPRDRYQAPADAAKALQPFLVIAEQRPPEMSSLAKSYLSWVEQQPFEEVNDAPTAAERWFYSHQGQILGPVPSAQLTPLAAKALLDPDDYLWLEGDDPAFAIPARTAVDFPSLHQARKDAGRSTQKQSSKVQARSALPPGAAKRGDAVADMGYNPETGQVLDPVKFRKWQRDQQLKKEAEMTPGPTSYEAFLKARVHLDRWLDFERNRRPILAGDMDFVRQDPDIQRFMQYYTRFGQEIIYKLWQYLEFMVENRRKYYCALGY